MKSIEIPNSITCIRNDAFSDCSFLKSIIIPNSVTSIGEGVFWNCSSLTIYCEASSQLDGWNSSWNNEKRTVYWSKEWSYVNGVPTPNK